MGQIRKLLPALLATACLVLRISSGAQATECTQPDAERINTQLKLDVASLQAERLLLFEFKGQPLQWVALTWFGPVHGMLAVLDCTGRAISAEDTGAYGTGEPVAIAGYRYPVLLSSYQSGSGTDGAEVDTTGLFAFNGRKIVRLWEHASDIQGFMLCEDTTAEHYRIELSRDAHAIMVSGERKRSQGRLAHGGCTEVKTRIIKLQQERYCWNGQRYVKTRAQQCRH